jgi:hypothetical protein
MKNKMDGICSTKGESMNVDLVVVQCREREYLRDIVVDVR